MSDLLKDWQPVPAGHKHVVSVSLGNSKRNARETFTLLSQPFILERLGTDGDSAQAETVRKMVVAMAQDIRVLVIKLADRLHNARTWRYVSVESATRKAMDERLARPFLGGHAQQEGERGSHEIVSPDTGFVMHVSTDLLQARAEALDAQLHVHVLPGDFIGPGTVIADSAVELLAALARRLGHPAPGN